MTILQSALHTDLSLMCSKLADRQHDVCCKLMSSFSTIIGFWPQHLQASPVCVFDLQHDFPLPKLSDLDLDSCNTDDIPVFMQLIVRVGSDTDSRDKQLAAPRPKSADPQHGRARLWRATSAEHAVPDVTQAVHAAPPTSVGAWDSSIKLCRSASDGHALADGIKAVHAGRPKSANPQHGSTRLRRSSSDQHTVTDGLKLVHAGRPQSAGAGPSRVGLLRGTSDGHALADGIKAIHSSLTDASDWAHAARPCSVMQHARSAPAGLAITAQQQQQQQHSDSFAALQLDCALQKAVLRERLQRAAFKKELADQQLAFDMTLQWHQTVFRGKLAAQDASCAAASGEKMQAVQVEFETALARLRRISKKYQREMTASQAQLVDLKKSLATPVFVLVSCSDMHVLLHKPRILRAHMSERLQILLWVPM